MRTNPKPIFVKVSLTIGCFAAVLCMAPAMTASAAGMIMETQLPPQAVEPKAVPASEETPGPNGANHTKGMQWDVLFDQGGMSADNGVTAQNFESAFDAYDAEGGDDFVVDAADGWTVHQVKFASGGSTWPPASQRRYPAPAG